MLKQKDQKQIEQFMEASRLLGASQVSSLLTILLEVAKRDELCVQQIEALFGEPATSASQEAAQTSEGMQGASQKAEAEPEKTKETTAKAKKSTRRAKAPAVLNPLEIYQQGGEDVLREELEKLEVTQLKDIIDDYDLDPLKQYSKKRKKEILIDVIVVVSRQRATKGDGFI